MSYTTWAGTSNKVINSALSILACEHRRKTRTPDGSRSPAHKSYNSEVEQPALLLALALAARAVDRHRRARKGRYRRLVQAALLLACLRWRGRLPLRPGRVARVIFLVIELLQRPSALALAEPVRDRLRADAAEVEDLQIVHELARGKCMC